MGDSLQDQLRALGLAQKPAKKERSRKPGPRNKGAASEKPRGGREMPLDKAWALREQSEKKQAEAARMRKQAEDRRRRQINGEIRKIVEACRQNREDAEIARNFLYKGRIRKVYVTAEQQQTLNQGALGIAYLTGGYHLLPLEALEAVRAISPEHVVDLAAESGDEDDVPVPDDLVW